MLTVEAIEAIRRAYYREQQRVRAIAREQGHGRRVVRDAIRGETPGRRQYRLRVRKRRPVLDPVSAIIDAWLAADQAAPREQRHTAKRIHERLVVEHGFGGGERQVRQYVAEWKQAHRSDAAGDVARADPPGPGGRGEWGAGLGGAGGGGAVARLVWRRGRRRAAAVCLVVPAAPAG